MSEARPHNAQDGRCRYTLGAERCPAPGVVRVGQWWVCALHECWAEAPSDPGLAEEGRVALRIQRERAGLPAAGAGGAAQVSEHGLGVARASGARLEALAELDEVLGGEISQAREERRRRIGERAVAFFSRAVRERRVAGVDGEAAILSAVREVACAAIDQHWGAGR